jgi:hypothetical protein
MAFQRSKHLLSLLLEQASRRYEYRRPATDAFAEPFERRDALGSRNEFSEAFRFLDSTIRLSPEPSQPPPERSLAYA